MKKIKTQKYMRTILTILCISIFIVSCKEEKKKTDDVNNHSEHQMEEKS